MSLIEFIEKKLDDYAEIILSGSEKVDEHALGEMIFYMTMRRVLSEKATMQDIGMLDAVNDTLQELAIVGADKTFYKE